MYELVDLLKPETKRMVASGNFEALINAQRPTQTQIKRFHELTAGNNSPVTELDSISKHELNKMIFALERK